MDNHGRVDNSESNTAADAAGSEVANKERYFSERWSEICRESHRVKKGKGRQRRLTLDPSVDMASKLLAEVLGVTVNEVVDHAMAALCREYLDPVPRGVKSYRESLDSIMFSMRKLEREMVLFNDLAFQALVAGSTARTGGRE